MKILQYTIVMLCVVALGGCGKGNSNAPATVDPVSKKAHPDPNWLATTHKKTKATEIPNCAECHGGDFKGGIVNVACIKCHPNGPQGGPPHATDLSFRPGAQHGPEAKKSLAYCGSCHGNGTNQPYNTLDLSLISNGKGCDFCHFQNTNLAHPYGWIPGRGGSTTTSHATAGDLVTSCGLCHGAALDGVGGIAPSCSGASTIAGVVGCHTPGISLVNTNCTSCHGAPPAGTVAPNRAFGHAAHWNISGIGIHGGCAVCHFGKGAGTAAHANGGAAEVAFEAARFDEFGVATYAGGACSNVSCHGQNALDATWVLTAPVIDKTDQTTCVTTCHQLINVVYDPLATVKVPYIGPYSGRQPSVPGAYGNNLHTAHFERFNIECTACHTLANHFDRLLHPRKFVLPRGFAAPTIGIADTPLHPSRPTKVATYDPVTGNCTTTICHVQIPDPLDPLKMKYRWYQ